MSDEFHKYETKIERLASKNCDGDRDSIEFQKNCIV